MPERPPIVSPRTGKISPAAAEALGLPLSKILAKDETSPEALLIDIGDYVDGVSRAYLDQTARRHRVSPRLSLNLEPTQLLKAGLAGTHLPPEIPIYLVRVPDSIRERAFAVRETEISDEISDSLLGFLLPGEVLLTPQLVQAEDAEDKWIVVRAPALRTSPTGQREVPPASSSSKSGGPEEPATDGLAIMDMQLMSQAGSSLDEHIAAFRGRPCIRNPERTTANSHPVAAELQASCQAMLQTLETDFRFPGLDRLEYFFVGSGTVAVPGSEAADARSPRGFLTPPALIYRDASLAPLIFSHACASVIFALHRAEARVRSGAVDAVLLAGGLQLSPETVQSMSSLGTLSGRQARPFDDQRDGTYISPGYGALLVMHPETARGWGQVPLGIISALHIDIEDFAAATDSDQVAQHLSATVNTDSNAPDAVVAHATGTIQGDVSEASALAGILNPSTPVVASKGATGHLLHAAGFPGIAHALALLGQTTIAGTVGLTNPLPGPLRLPREGQAESLSGPIQRVLVNSVGFGGNLGSLVLRSPLGESALSESANT